VHAPLLLLLLLLPLLLLRRLRGAAAAACCQQALQQRQRVRQGLAAAGGRADAQVVRRAQAARQLAPHGRLHREEAGVAVALPRRDLQARVQAADRLQRHGGARLEGDGHLRRGGGGVSAGGRAWSAAAACRRPHLHPWQHRRLLWRGRSRGLRLVVWILVVLHRC
jgi:hypothetical protein